MDDILIYGSNMNEHNQILKSVQERLKKYNVKLSKNKMQIAQKKVKYLGHEISGNGIAVQQSKIEAIEKLKCPQSRAEVQRFLGMVTYLAKFIPNLSDKTMALRKLISKKNEWSLGEEQQKCYENLKHLVSSAPVLKFFDPKKPTSISTDASKFGIGAVILQDGHPIEYASISLNEAQKRYAQIEKELLALVIGCERFHYYLWGTEFEAETDHKPLLRIMEKPLEKLSPRLQRMVLRLMRYQVKLKFVPGKDMHVADYLSRDPLENQNETDYLEGKAESVHTVLSTTEDKMKRLQLESKEDSVMCQLSKFSRDGWPSHRTDVPEEVRPFWQFQDEIHECDDIIYRGDRIVVPTALRKEILQVVHSSHQGIVASKNRTRASFFWPGMATQVEKQVSKCRTCQENSRSNPEETLIAHEIPRLPWEKIAVDFMKVNGNDYLLLVDYNSKFVEVRHMNNKKELETIGKLKSVFRTHGIPSVLMSDNGPPFNSHGFKKFTNMYGFDNRTSSPKYPRSNGQVERTIQTAKGLIVKAVNSKNDPNLAIMEFNNTPKHDLPSPAQLLMGHPIRKPSTYSKRQLKPLFNTNSNHEQLLKRQEKFAGKVKRVLPPFEIGDPVILHEAHRQWSPATVIEKNANPRSYIVKTNNGRKFRRNRIHLKSRKFDDEEQTTDVELPSTSTNVLPCNTPTAPEIQQNDNKCGGSPSDSPLPTEVRTRSGRLIKKPFRFRH